MDLGLVKLGLDYTRRRKKWVLLLAAFGFSGYGAYRVYHAPAVAKKRARLFKLFGALISVVEAVSDSAETIGFVSKDLREFLQSDSDQIPNSLKQFSKITTSEEFSETVIRVTRALTAGLLRGYGLGAKDSGGEMGYNSPSVTEKVMDKVFSPAGSGFASIAVGSFARNLVMGFFSGEQLSGGFMGNGSEDTSVAKWVDLLCSDKCRELIGDCVQSFVSTAVSVYLEKTVDINTYDEIFQGLTNPKHEGKVKDMFASVCNGAVETLIRTSHEVITNPNQKTKSTPITSYLAISGDQTLGKVVMEDFGKEPLSSGLRPRSLSSEIEDNGLVGKMLSTLTVPSNKRLVLDVTGMVTFETVRSFLEFLLEKVLSGLKRGFSIVQHAVEERGAAAVRYVTARSSVIVTLCLSLCLHILDSSFWFFGDCLSY